MKTIEQMQAAVDEIREVCKRHGIVIIGTCKAGGVYGEITIFENNEQPTGWLNPQNQLTNQVEKLDHFQVCGIGDLHLDQS
jgi:hypothetical protein